MVVYNVTVSVDPSVHEDWVDWMKRVHIPGVMATGCFLEHRFLRVLTGGAGELTYSIQYVCSSMREYETYRDRYASALQAEHTERYADKFVAFRTLLETA